MSAYNNIAGAQKLPDVQQVFDALERLSQRLQENNQRVLINGRGSRDWCLALTRYLTTRWQASVFSNEPDMPEAIAFGKADRLLGSESGCVIIDGFSGLQIDLLCMTSGLLRGGGLMLLLTDEHPQQMADRYGIWQGVAAQKKHFLQYFFAQFEHSRWVMRASDEPGRITQIDLAPSPAPRFIDQFSEQQAQLFEQLQAWRDDKQKPVFVLTADRGRGKSTLLGRFARTITSEQQVVISAVSKFQLSVLFSQLARAETQPCFMPPDEIIRQGKVIDLLIIDEAAMLPLHVLQQCLSLAKKTLLATTTGGYEGSGGGFLLKFLRSIPPSQCSRGELQQPIRWGDQDALEQWLNRVLMLKQATNDVVDVAAETIIRSIDKAQLAGDENLLQAIYGLLVSAHYRTRPSDLRQLMEDEHQQIIIAEQQQQVVGVVLLNREGGFTESLSCEIFMGRRRPQGHLLAQMMTAQAGVKLFATLKGMRIQRIAVAENVRRQGVGRRLVEAAMRQARAAEMDYIGSNFALDDTVLPFWRSLAFEALHVSAGRGVASAQQTVAVLMPLQERAHQMLEFQRAKIHRELPLWLQGYCRDIDTNTMLELLKILQINECFNAQETDELEAFAEGYRGLEYTRPLLQRLLISRIYRCSMDESDVRLAIRHILQQKNDSPSAQNDGKKQRLQRIRKIIAQLRTL